MAAGLLEPAEAEQSECIGPLRSSGRDRSRPLNYGAALRPPKPLQPPEIPMKVPALVALLGLLPLLFQDGAKSAAKLPAVGQPAPAIRLNDQTGTIQTLGGKTKNWSVLAFYPKAMTSGCTSEMCSIRDALSDLQTIGVDLYGISLDSVQEQAQFVEKNKLTFPL